MQHYEGAAVGESDGGKRTLAFVGGFVVAGVCFVLAFAVLAYLIPLFDRFLESRRSGLIPAVCILFISCGALIRHLKRRRKPSGRSARS